MAGWHVGKEIPIAVIAMMIMQTIGLVWFLAQMDSRVSELESYKKASELYRVNYENKVSDRLNSLEINVASMGATLRNIDKNIDRMADNMGDNRQ